jgi:hypothetical protein
MKLGKWEDGGMKDMEFFERVLGFRELWSVKDIEVDMEGGWVVV